MLLAVVTVSGCTQPPAPATPPSTTVLLTPAGSASGKPAPTGPGSVPVPADAQSARVRAIVDGDTLHLVGVGGGPLPAGQDERVRLLEINAPEIHGTIDCFGPEATTALTALVPVGSMVRVVPDREARDKYGRPLLYVWNASGVFVNLALVRDGAAVALLIRPNDRHIAEMRAAETQARNDRRGQWGTCH